MKKLILPLLGLVPVFCSGQYLVKNEGAMIKVQAGATLFVEGGIHNTTGGTIDNDGTIDVQGHFLNEGSWNDADPNILKFSGTTDADLTPGSAIFQTVQMAKTAGGDVNLLGHATIQTLLDFNGSDTRIILNNKDLRLAGTATVAGESANEYVLTGGTGKMKKFYASTGTFKFPVGFDAATYNPAEVNITAGSPDTIGVRVLAAPTDGNGLTGTPITSDVVNAVWDISESTVGGNTANVTLSWSDALDELPGFNDNLNTVSRNDGVNGWDGLFADLGPESPADTRTRNGFTAFGAFAVGDRPIANELVLNIDAFLQGPYNTATDLMSDALRTFNYIPLTEPYTAAPYSYGHVGYGGGENVPSNAVFDQAGTNDDIIDWIVVEIRNAATPATKLATKTALLQRDGDIVDLDGVSSLRVGGLADGTYHVGIRHRNHITVRTQTALALNNTAASLNFKVAGTAFDNGTGSAPQKELEAGVFGLWAGDANLDNRVRVTPLTFPPPGVPSDRTYILDITLGGNPSGQFNGYSNSDINMDGRTRITPLTFPPPGVPSDATFILDNVLGGNPAGQITADN